MRRLERQKTEQGKKNRIQRKINRTEEQTLSVQESTRLIHMVLKAATSSTQRLKEDSLKIPVTQAAIADGTDRWDTLRGSHCS
ncbi:hypothetical protein OS493_017610 [Desmophyllum pertusum]|uniref:Uncharacterized protein n=1 Tax=Desmophyllum pertusum TaxID=174260 RepID=A0A9W9ZCF1_9CNID|nr:hypothetical protein OS493_017610 [Desmophyllum pertusum]